MSWNCRDISGISQEILSWKYCLVYAQWKEILHLCEEKKKKLSVNLCFKKVLYEKLVVNK